MTAEDIVHSRPNLSSVDKVVVSHRRQIILTADVSLTVLVSLNSQLHAKDGQNTVKKNEIFNHIITSSVHQAAFFS